MFSQRSGTPPPSPHLGYGVVDRVVKCTVEGVDEVMVEYDFMREEARTLVSKVVSK